MERASERVVPQPRTLVLYATLSKAALCYVRRLHHEGRIPDDGASRSQVLATNVFERTGGEWLMILHHGSPIMAPPDDEPPLQ